MTIERILQIAKEAGAPNFRENRDARICFNCQWLARGLETASWECRKHALYFGYGDAALAMSAALVCDDFEAYKE